jgi:hypothetical protein
MYFFFAYIFFSLISIIVKNNKIVTYGDSKNNGPVGISLDLISNNKVIDSTLSGADGSYYFSNVMPGGYEIEAHHPSIKFQTVNIIYIKFDCIYN